MDKDIQIAHEVTVGLLESWFNLQPPFAVGTKKRPVDPMEIALVLPLSAHTHRLIAAAVQLVDDEKAFETMPLVRSAFETAVQAMWISQTSDGASALSNEYSRTRLALKQSIEKSSLATFGGIQLAEFERMDTASAEQAKKFWLMCDDFKGGSDLYLTYRILSGYCHAGIDIADRYLQEDESESRGFSVLTDPRLDNLGLGILWTAASRSVLWT
ncbi:DUF5677 domain-containing protein [Aeromicrobium duanguangcaii]|uniref:DUF5677 domain-containing protein n=1 Tax=Aeromicrobium duanguangcaii TaxID=2968086 RepID=UPI002016FE7E|nr:DUF5677 domain-containing protein [Aeromicrobium duanguangcaii]MCL3838016.1 hypothetical protein [Aeromicrobium duanguangcaii]